MALTLSGTNGVVGAGFTVDASGVSVTAGVGTFSSLQGSGANLTALPAANLTGTLPALNAASLTQIPAANLVGLCTSGFERTGGFGGGKILQIVSTTDNSTVTATGTVQELLNISITPSATTSKVLILASATCQCVPSTNVYGVLHLYRGNTSGTALFNTSAGQNSSFYNYVSMVINYLDSPSTTSATTYTTGINRNSGGTSSVSSDGNTYTLMALEVGA